MSTPLISVIIPVYNAAATLSQALASLWAQTSAPEAPLPSFEVIAVDDGSTDDSLLILEEARRAHSRLVVLHRQHEGISRALNSALGMARGRYLARMDADDIAHPQRLALQYAHLEDVSDLHLSACTIEFGGDREKAHGFAHFVDWQNTLCSHEAILRNRFRDTPICHPSVLFRREAVELFGGYREGDFPEDWEMWLRWLDAGARMEKLSVNLLKWNDSSTRLTRVDRRYSEVACDRLRAYWLSRELNRSNPFHPRVWVIGAGKVARRRLSHLWRIGIEPVAFIDIDPRKIGNVVGGVPVVSRQALPAPGRCVILNALTGHGAAEEAACWLQSEGYSPDEWWLT